MALWALQGVLASLTMATASTKDFEGKPPCIWNNSSFTLVWVWVISMKKPYQTISATVPVNRSENQAEVQLVGFTPLRYLFQPGNPYQSDFFFENRRLS